MPVNGHGERISEAERDKLMAVDKDEASRIPQDHEWPPPIGNPQLRKSFWCDPEPDCAGVLTADRIRTYHYEVGRMIRPFQEEHLNPASYDLTLGPHCVVDGKEVILGANRRILEIPPSSIAFVTSREELLIPPWLTATFNLKSTYIFDGLLMGVGPQVDPGYMGVLTCPLHNISSNTIRLSFLMPFAKLDFVKTTWGKNVDVDDIQEECAFYEQGENGKLLSRDGGAVKILARQKGSRPLPGHGPEATGATSSLQKLEKEFKEVQLSLRIGQFAVLAFITVLLAAGTFLVRYTDSKVNDALGDSASATQMEQSPLIGRRVAQIERAIARESLGPPR